MKRTPAGGRARSLLRRSAPRSRVVRARRSPHVRAQSTVARRDASNRVANGKRGESSFYSKGLIRSKPSLVPPRASRNAGAAADCASASLAALAAQLESERAFPQLRIHKVEQLSLVFESGWRLASREFFFSKRDYSLALDDLSSCGKPRSVCESYEPSPKSEQVT